MKYQEKIPRSPWRLHMRCECDGTKSTVCIGTHAGISVRPRLARQTQPYPTPYVYGTTSGMNSLPAVFIGLNISKAAGTNRSTMSVAV